VSGPAAVTVFDVVDDGDTVFIVMELVDGSSLDRTVRERGPLTSAATAAIGVRLCDALAAAHGVGVIHRDVKPSNVLLAGDPPGAKLADFGIASIRDDPGITATGTFVGSPAFMAPEQAQGRAATEATDRWGLGATLYFAVEGESPFDRGSAMATVAAVLEEPPRRCARAGRLEPTILALLDKDPQRRPPLDAVRYRLASTGDEDRLTVEATVPRPPVRAPRRHRLAWLAVAAVGVVGIAAAVTFLGSGSGPDRDERAVPVGTDSGSSPGASSTTGVTEWVAYTDPATGFGLRHPAGWRLTRPTESRTELHDDASGVSVSVEWTDRPAEDPVAPWRRLAGEYATTVAGYTELRLEPSRFRDAPAAVWEFTYDHDGSTMRTLAVGLRASDLGFALLFRAPATLWNELEAVRVSVFDGFQPATDPPGDRKDGGDD
jgi:hypothetical protein